jgi:hypothetical protein
MMIWLKFVLYDPELDWILNTKTFWVTVSDQEKDAKSAFKQFSFSLTMEDIAHFLLFA